MPEPHAVGRCRAPALALLVLVALTFTAAAPGHVHAVDPPTPDSQRGGPDGPEGGAESPGPRPTGRILVRFRDGVAPAQQHDALSAQGLAETQVLRGPSQLEIVLPGPQGPDAALAALRRRPEVAFADHEYYRFPLGDPSAEPRFDEQWALENRGQEVNTYVGVPDVDVNAPEAWQITHGSPELVVAVIDDGVDFGHPDLAGSAWVNPGESGRDTRGRDKRTNRLDDDGNGYVDDVHGWDFCNDDNTVHDAGRDWHGTAMAGVIAGAANEVGIAGLAPEIRIMALKFIDTENPACSTDAQAIEAIHYAAAKGVRISNNSWGAPGANVALEAAIEESAMLFVAAAGNQGLNNDSHPERTYPAAFDSPNILAVAAVHNEGWLSSFSNFGTASVDIAAPGEDILTAVPAGTTHCLDLDPANTGPDWALCSGTSPAAAHATGVAALVASARPHLSADPVSLRQQVIATGKPLPLTQSRTASGRMVEARAGVVARPDIARLAGEDRFGTAADIANGAFQPYPDRVLVATGENFPDALAGGAPGAQFGYPVLLVNQNAIPESTAAELERLRPDEIIVLGSPAAVSTTVESDLSGYAPMIRRIGGRDRYETAAGLARFLYRPGVPTAYIAVGTTFPDALAAAPASALSGGPLLLVQTDAIPQAIRDVLTDLKPRRIVILGSEGVISQAVATQLDAYTTGPVLRWSGSDRYKTAVAISRGAFQGMAAANARTVFIATGNNFPDALAGGPAGGAYRGPLLLVPGDTVPPEVEAEIVRLNPSRVFVLGGDTVVTEQVVNEINALFP
jgi:subtilisin family serine protease